MATDVGDNTEDIPWPQRLLDSIWILALAAIVFWALAYIVWGVIDILVVPLG
jgi:hypothetical protein